jgi:hypothetical protein
MVRSLVVASALAMGSLTLAHPAAAAGPAAPLNQSLAGEAIVEQVQWRYCRRWHRECRYRWGYGWRYRRCMRRHGC